MPELPEVETIVRGLKNTVVGKKIVGIVVYDPLIRKPRVNLPLVIKSAERRGKCRERDPRHQQRFSRPQPPTPAGAGTSDIHVRFVIVDDLTERQAEMVVQGELKHGSPFSGM